MRAAIDYLYDQVGVNTERVVRDSAGNELRRIRLDEHGNELEADVTGPVRWASMDGSETGTAEKGQEIIAGNKAGDELKRQ